MVFAYVCLSPVLETSQMSGPMTLNYLLICKIMALVSGMLISMLDKTENAHYSCSLPLMTAKT